MKKDMPLEGLRWSRDSGSALYDTPQNGRSRTGWGAKHVCYTCHSGSFSFPALNNTFLINHQEKCSKNFAYSK